MNMIRWGIVGCGDVTEVKSGPAFQKVKGSDLVAVMRRDRDKAADYAKRHKVPRWYDDATALINDSEVDAVYIATPPGSHEHLALQVCAAGKPCYVEKPMARSYAECNRMVEAFHAARLPLFVAYYRRGLPRFAEAKKIVESGVLGTVSGVSLHHAHLAPQTQQNQELPWRMQAEHAGAGLYLDLASHALDILDFLFGPLEEVAGAAANRAGAYDVEDTVAMSFRAGGAPAVATWNFAASHRQDTLRIEGTQGALTMSVFGNEPLRLETGGTTEEFVRPHPEHVQQPLIQSMVDELLGRGQCPSHGESAARTSRVMDIALESYYGGRSDPFWERPQTWPGKR
jgi:predicted dehydrogenase